MLRESRLSGTKKPFLLCAGSVFVIASIISLPATAQDASEELAVNDDTTVIYDPITVTARKRVESLQDVPLSIQAFTAEMLDDADIDNIQDLAGYTPGLTLFENVDRGYGQIFIRGLQNTPPRGDTTRELASVFIDGVFFTGGVSAINTDNIERVEVIRGPQSALFGRATFSGAVNFITKTPGNDFAANVRTLIASDDEYEVSGSVEGPLVKDILAGRISARYHEFGGQYTNSFNGGPLGEQQDMSYSGQLYFTPTNKWSAKLSATYLEQEDGPAASALVGRLPNHNFTAPNGDSFFRGEQGLDTAISQNPFPTDPSDILGIGPGFTFVPFDTLPEADRLSIRRNGLDREFVFVSLDTSYEFDGGHALTYLGSFSEEDAARLWDFELSPEDNYFGSRKTDSESNYHEIRFSSPDDQRLTWLVGASYFNQTLFERDPGAIFGGDIPFFPAVGDGQVVVAAGPRSIVNRDINTYAAFGSVSYDFSDQLSASFEGRFQNDELEDIVDPVAGTTLSGSTESFLPRLIAEYTPDPSLLLYASAAKGIRPTTINSQFAARPDTEQAALRAAFPELDIALLAPEETIWTYEIGAKKTLNDGRGVFNVNAYYADWTDSQDLRSLLADVDGDMIPDSTLVTINGADIEAMGVEIDGAYALTDELSVSGAAAWNHTELKDQDALVARFFLDESPPGNRLSSTPEYSANFAGTYRDALGSSGFDWSATLEGIYVGSRYASSLNLAETGSSFDLNLRFGLENDRYSIQFFGTNLTQDDTFESLASNADCATSASCLTRANEAILPTRRQFGIILSADF